MKIVHQVKQTALHAYSWFLKASLKQKAVVIGAIAVGSFITIPKVLSSNPQIKYQTAQVDRGSVISTVSESGSVSSISQTAVTSPSNGVIEDIYVKNGDIVSVGQSLFKIHSTATEAEKASAYASYLASLNDVKTAQQSKQSLQAQLEQSRQAVLAAQIAVDTLNNNRNSGGINPATKQQYTQNEIDSIDSALTSAKESFTATETKYNQADSGISAASASQNSTYLAYLATQDSEVKAPIDGTVANLSATIGTSVTSSGGGNAGNSSSSSSSASTSAPVLIIGNFSSLTIATQISEMDIAKVKAGQKATVTLDAFPDKTFVGTVSSIDTVGTTTSGVVSFNAYVNLLAPPADIHPGMSASILIQTDRRDDALKVVSSAVQTSNGSSTVRIMKDNKVTTVPVEVGISSDEETEITSGLSEGDIVVTSAVTSTKSGINGQTTSPFGGTTRGFGGAGGFGGARQSSGRTSTTRGGQ